MSDAASNDAAETAADAALMAWGNGNSLERVLALLTVCDRDALPVEDEEVQRVLMPAPPPPAPLPPAPPRLSPVPPPPVPSVITSGPPPVENQSGV